VKPTSIDALREEVMGVGAVILRAPLVHPAGVLLHPEGTLLTIPRLKDLREAGFTQLFLLEPGETLDTDTVRRTLTTEVLPLPRVRPGDRLEEDLRAPDGATIAAAGATVDARLIEVAARAGVEKAVIRTRGLGHAIVLVLEYVNGLPPQAPVEGLRWDSPIVPLLVPRAKVGVSVRAEPHRSLIVETLAAEGHEVQAIATAVEAARLVRLQQADVAIIDAADAAEVRPILLDPTKSRAGAVLALGGEMKGAEVLRILQCGVNDLVTIPLTPGRVLEKVMGGLQTGGRRTRTTPLVRVERRALPRARESLSCRIVDLLSGAPLPVSGAAIFDRTEGGVRIEYRPPDRKDAQWVRGGTVHPLHFFHPYAQSNALGNDLLVSIALPGRPPFEARARVVWVELRRETEEAGLIFRKGMTTIRPAPPTATRRPGF
jgi:CheY-like chemotaxis protein